MNRPEVLFGNLEVGRTDLGNQGDVLAGDGDAHVVVEALHLNLGAAVLRRFGQHFSEREALRSGLKQGFVLEHALLRTVDIEPGKYDFLALVIDDFKARRISFRRVVVKPCGEIDGSRQAIARYRDLAALLLAGERELERRAGQRGTPSAEQAVERLHFSGRFAAKDSSHFLLSGVIAHDDRIGAAGAKGIEAGEGAVLNFGFHADLNRWQRSRRCKWALARQTPQDRPALLAYGKVLTAVPA